MTHHLHSETLIAVEGVSKKFCRSLRRSLWYGMKGLCADFCGIHPNPELRQDEFWALDRVSLTVGRGEAVALIGSNGSGKTTLLRLITGIFPPDAGQITIRGRVGALIALGAGFHPHYSGRENVFINAAILGMSRDETQRRFAEIVDFAEIGPAIDAPVSTYSSGMRVRLGFAVAAFIEPEIMLVDEVLAVGDMAFRAKCADKLARLRAGGMALLFVGHDMNAVQSVCDRAVWLEQGRVRLAGSSTDVIEAYMREMDERTLQRGLDELRREGLATGDIAITGVRITDANDRDLTVIRPFDPLFVHLHYRTTRPLERPHFWVGIASEHGAVGGASMLFDGHCPDRIEGEGVIRCRFDSLPLMPQVYRLRAGIRSADGMTMLVESRQVGLFRVEGDARDLGMKGNVAASLTRHSAPVLFPYAWNLDGRTWQPVRVAPREPSVPPAGG